MSVIGTFNGASIIAWPDRPGIKEIELIATDSVAVSKSPYTGTQQVQWWPGGDMWTANLTMPQMTSCDAAEWGAFLLQLRGMRNVFLLGHPQKRVPRGIAKGLPVVSGANSAMSVTLTTKGWLPNVRGQLLPGDQIQLGYRLHEILDRVDSDAHGNATLSCWPSLREAITDATPIILNSPKGLFRLAENKRSRTSTETRLTALQTIKCMEAR